MRLAIQPTLLDEHRYRRPDVYATMMRSAIAVNASFFNTQWMLAQYEANACFPETLTKAPSQPT
jgi:hypothetical protein